jgi:carboxylesterase type B
VAFNGTGMLYDGAYLASIGQVIIVTINYRLGVFGFMSIGNGTMTGNYGIWDQRMAIEWVHDNIESFGGDVNNVTIFGESAGGFSVAFDLLLRSVFGRSEKSSPSTLGAKVRKICGSCSGR